MSGDRSPEKLALHFTDRARAAIADPQLRIALERTTAQFGLRRSTALATLDDVEAVRDRARHAKMELLRHLGDSLRTFAARAGHSEKYHDTLTIFWVRLLASARGAFQEPPIHLAEVLSGHPYLLDKNTPLAYYSRQRLFSNEARGTWIPPDLKALSGDGPAADPGNTSSDAPHRTVSRATPALRPVAR